MAKAYVAFPSADLVTAATLSATNANSLYPVTNLQNDDPADPFKATSTAVNITVSHASAPRVAVALINHNLAGATVTAGSLSVTIPNRTADGQCVNAVTVLSLGAAASTTISITGASSLVQIGRICLVSSLSAVNWRWGQGGAVAFDTEWPVNEIMTHGGTVNIYNKGYRVRSAGGSLIREADRALWTALAQSAQGRNVPFLFLPDLDVNDAWYVRLSESALRSLRRMTNATDIPVTLEEVSSGLPL